MVYLLALLVAIGIGLFVCGAYGERKATERDRWLESLNNDEDHAANSGENGYVEISRLFFGRYILNPPMNTFVEARCISAAIPAYDKIVELFAQKERKNSSRRFRASCSICVKGDEYLHRWLFCSSAPDSKAELEELTRQVVAEYRKSVTDDEGVEVVRATFGSDIPPESLRQYLELSGENEEIPCREKLATMFDKSKRICATCVVSKYDDIYLHRWSFYYAGQEDEDKLKEMMKRISRAYREAK